MLCNVKVLARVYTLGAIAIITFYIHNKRCMVILSLKVSSDNHSYDRLNSNYVHL